MRSFASDVLTDSTIANGSLGANSSKQVTTDVAASSSSIRFGLHQKTAPIAAATGYPLDA